jgi:Na+-transporting methylmalonyl-CoA/oxaloacetate decarboxylase beta subunit
MYIVYLLIVVLLILGIVDKIEKTIKESPMNIVYIMIGVSIGALIIYFLF